MEILFLISSSITWTRPNMINSLISTNLADGLDKPAPSVHVSEADVADRSAPVDQEVSVVGDLDGRSWVRSGDRPVATGPALVHLAHNLMIIIMY